MTNKDIVLKVHFDMGRADAAALREKACAGEITDTEIIANEHAVPLWSEKTDYTNAKPGTPVYHDGQDYGLNLPHNPAHYPGNTPATLPALWLVKHTKDPAKAKPYVKPTSTSDIYRAGECMLWTDGTVKRATRDTNFSPDEYAPDWEDVPA